MEQKQGITRIEAAKRTARLLLWEDAQFNRLLKARKAERYLFTRENYQEFPDFYAADAFLVKATRITEANPQQKEFLWSSGVRLIDYSSAKEKSFRPPFSCLPATRKVKDIRP